MAAETVLLERYLYELFTNDATLQSLIGDRVYSYFAEPYPVLPCILYEYQGAAQDTNSLGDSRISTPYLYSVKAVGPGNDMVSLQPIADQIDALLQAGRAFYPVSAPLLYARIRRVQPISEPRVMFGNNLFSFLGGVYRVTTSPVS